ncbi:MAG: methyltransferase domain-containing protein [bacterium]|nr:methyltransferase domain-containing protein [bacterium]
MTEVALAQSLRNNHEPVYAVTSRKSMFLEVDGVKTTFPYHELLAGDMPSPDFILENFTTCWNLMQPNKIPVPWVTFLKEVDQEKLKKGTDYPIDLIHGVFFLSHQEPRYEELGILPFEMDEFYGPDFRNADEITERINRVLADDELRAKLKKSLAIATPGLGQSYLDMEIVKQVLEGQNVSSGVLVELGCGQGSRTAEWQESTSLTTIGIDRLYRETWYTKYWVDGPQENPNMHFIRGDITEGIPLKAESVDVVVMEDVVQYIAEDKLSGALQDITRVLKPETGLLFVGPEQTENTEPWRVFRKEHTSAEKNYSLVEYSIVDLTKQNR